MIAELQQSDAGDLGAISGVAGSVRQVLHRLKNSCHLILLALLLY